MIASNIWTEAFRAAVFIDKDGTLIEDIPYNVDPALVRFTVGAIEGLSLLQQHGFRIILVTNQPGVAMGLFDEAALTLLERALILKLSEAGVRLDGFYACPHSADSTGSCGCRKPAPGLLLRAARELNIDLQRSWMVGDILNDVEAGRAAGCRTVLMDVGNETEWLVTPQRMPEFSASTLLDAARHIVQQHYKTQPPATAPIRIAAPAPT